MCRLGWAVLRSHWQDQRVPFASRFVGSNHGPSRLVPPPSKVAAAYRENRSGREKLRSSRPKNFALPELSFAVRSSENDHKPVGIANPYLLVVGSQINVRFFDNLRVQ